MPDLAIDELNRDLDGIGLRNLLEAINQRITVLLDRDHQIGHSYLMTVRNTEDLKKVFQNKIIPLLQEYFYDDWEKIDLVLNRNGFIVDEGVAKDLLRGDAKMVDDDKKMYRLLSADDEEWDEPASYQKIYPQNSNKIAQDEK